MIGIGAAYVLFIVQTAIFTKRRLLAVGHGRYASRRLVVSDGEAWEHTRAGSNRLNADTIKGTARGKRALFLDHDAGGKVVIPLEVADDPSVHDALLAAIARSTPADAPPR